MMPTARVGAVELSALREAELMPLLDSLESIDLARFSYVSIHAPSQFPAASERAIRDRLSRELWRNWPIIVHPDAIYDFEAWQDFGSLLCIENMDKRKPIGRSAGELEAVFNRLPDASLCLDIGHARQFDTTMTEAYLILREFGSRLQQVHISEVNTRSKHDVLSFASILAFQEVAHLIPEDVPIILETPVSPTGMKAELAKVEEALPIQPQVLVG